MTELKADRGQLRGELAGLRSALAARRAQLEAGDDYPPAVRMLHEHTSRVLARVEGGIALRGDVEALIAGLVDAAKYHASNDAETRQRDDFLEGLRRIAALLPLSHELRPPLTPPEEVAEIERLLAALDVHGPKLAQRDDVAPAAKTAYDHAIYVLDRVRRGIAIRAEVEDLIIATREFEQWHLERGQDPFAANRREVLEHWERLAAMVPVTLSGRPPVGDRLRQARKSAGLRIVDVAKAVEVDKATVSRWEHGKQALSSRHRVTLAAIYGRSPSDFEE